MIYNDTQGWSVCTPPKSGTYTLEKHLKPYARLTRPRHAMTKWAGERFMPVRKPIQRWMSMYRFLRKTGYWLAEEAQEGVVAFAEAWIERQDHVHWAPNLTEYYNEYEPHHCFLMHNDGIQQLLNSLSKKYALPKMEAQQKNKTDRSSFESDLRTLMNCSHWHYVKTWAEEDCDTFRIELW